MAGTPLLEDGGGRVVLAIDLPPVATESLQSPRVGNSKASQAYGYQLRRIELFVN